VPATSYWGSFPASDTGDPGWVTFGYTAQFGNGISATIAAEERRMTQIANMSGPVGSTATGSVAPGGFPTATAGITANAGAYGGFQMPDIVGNLRVDQAWGSAQIMSALHQVNANYYNNGAIPASGHPDDRLGWVVGAGIKLNAPMIGQGDFFQAQINYTQGALKYIFQTPNTNWGKVQGTTEGFGVLSDAVFGGTPGNVGATAATDLQLTTAWGINAAYEHFWNPRWRTSLYGGYAAVSYNDTATSLLVNTNLNPTPGFDMAWSTWWLGSRTQWNVTKDFYLGVDLMYAKLHSATTATGSPGGFVSDSATTVGDVDNWQFRFRVHRDFYP
jgi:hypothetical protein